DVLAVALVGGVSPGSTVASLKCRCVRALVSWLVVAGLANAPASAPFNCWLALVSGDAGAGHWAGAGGRSSDGGSLHVFASNRAICSSGFRGRYLGSQVSAELARGWRGNRYLPGGLPGAHDDAAEVLAGQRDPFFPCG